MFKKMFKRLWDLLSTPAKAWKVISIEESKGKPYLKEFFYPLIGFASITSFINPFIKGGLTINQMAWNGIQSALVVFGSGFFGFMLASRLLDWIFVRWFDQKPDLKKAEILAAYSSAPILAISLLTRLISEFFFMKVFFLYIFAVIWEAATNFYSIDEKQQGRFTGAAGAVILLSPLVIEFLLRLILPGLK